VLFPSLAVIAVERTDEEQRGAALGLFTAFFDAGVGVGAPLAGVLAAVTGYTGMFLATGALAAAGALVVAFGLRSPARRRMAESRATA
jgi:predicted MFS family arabinose efflux permease